MTNLAIAKSPDTNAALYESLALKGDLSGLSPEEKAKYYSALCERLGLDPATQPFVPLKLNGKEILYASKGATDQLARIHNVNRQIVDEKELRGVYIVTVEATLPNGRKEQSKGAVNLEGTKGDAFCNAIMKCETKAKRRATLSILGLGMLDESEMETIPAYAQQQATQIAPSVSVDVPETAETSEADNHRSAIVALCQNLNDSGDSIQWTRLTLIDYSKQLFDDEFITDTDNLPIDRLQFLAEDLGERLKLLKDNS